MSNGSQDTVRRDAAPARGQGAASDGGRGRPSSWRLSKTFERLALELGPALAFFLAVRFYDIYAGTIVLFAAGILSTALSWHRERRVPVVPLASLALTLGLGGATLILEQGRFIKMRPTIINSITALALAIGLMKGRVLLRNVLGAGIKAAPAAWRHVTLGAVVFLLLLAGLNEVVWRTMSTETWAGFKAFVIPAADALAIWLGYRHLKRHACP